MNKYKQVWLSLMPEARLNKKLGFFRLKIFGLDVGFCWPSAYGDFSLDIAFLGYGIAFALWYFWLIHETYDDFWGGE